MTVSTGCTKISTEMAARTSNPWTIPGALRIGVRQEPDNLNPVLSAQSIGLDIGMFWAALLLDYDEQGHYVPDLALTQPTLANGGISSDGRTITYHLRKGVAWQDGAPFTADDVIFTWRAIMDPNNDVPGRAGFEQIETIEKHDAYSLVVRLKRPYAPFVADFFTPAGFTNNVVLPKHLLAGYADINHAAYNRLPIGTGPYRVMKYEPDRLVQLEANPHYWRGAPRLHKIEIHIVPNDNTLATLIRSHELDFYYRVPHRISATLRAVPGTKVVSAWFTRFVEIAFNTENPILSDVRVRRALAYATDKPAIIETVAEGADLVADSDQPPSLWAHNPQLPQYRYDPARAAALLDSAGWHVAPDGVREKNGVRLRIGLAGAAGDVTSMLTREVVQAQWRRVGVEVELKSYPSDLLFAPYSGGGITQSGRFDAVLQSWANGEDPDDSGLFECRARPPGGENIFRFCDPSLDAIEEAALSTNVAAVRKADYARIQDMLARQLPVLVLWFDRYDYAVNTDLRNFKPAHVGSPFWNTWEWHV